MSGVTKVVRGDFPSGLADELREKSEGLSGWYKSFLDGTVIPNASGFAYAIEIGELLVGVALRQFPSRERGAAPVAVPADGFYEGIDLDSLLPAIQLVLVGVSVGLWKELRRTPHAEQQTRRVHPLERSLT